MACGRFAARDAPDELLNLFVDGHFDPVLLCAFGDFTIEKIDGGSTPSFNRAQHGAAHATIFVTDRDKKRVLREKSE